MDAKTQTQIFEDIHRYAMAAERLRVIATPTAIEVVRLLILHDQTKLDLTGAEIYNDRSMRRTLKRMAKVGLIRWEPWHSPHGEVSLTGKAKRILRAAGAGV
jgi:hypothetical protein